MLHVFDDAELQGKEALPPPEDEDDAIQRDIGGAIARRLMKQFGIADSRMDAIRNAVFSCLIEIGFSSEFRDIFCIKPSQIRPDIYEELKPLNNGERINHIFIKFGFSGLDNFLEKNMPYFEKALIQAGFDIRVSEAARRLLDEVV